MTEGPQLVGGHPCCGLEFQSVAVSEAPTAALTSPAGQGTEGLWGRSEPRPP